MQNITESISAGLAGDHVDRYLTEGETYVRQNPTAAALLAAGAGFLLAQLPLRWMFVALVRSALFLVKPATYLYAITKLIEDFQKSERQS